MSTTAKQDALRPAPGRLAGCLMAFVMETLLPLAFRFCDIGDAASDLS